MRVILFGQLNEVRQFLIARLQSFLGDGEKLSPMGAGMKWRKLAFDDRQQLADRRPIGFEGEMDGHGWLLVAGAHPKIIGGDRSDLRNQQMRPNLVAQPFYGKNGL